MFIFLIELDSRVVFHWAILCDILKQQTLLGSSSSSSVKSSLHSGCLVGWLTGWNLSLNIDSLLIIGDQYVGDWPLLVVIRTSWLGQVSHFVPLLVPTWPGHTFCGCPFVSRSVSRCYDAIEMCVPVNLRFNRRIIFQWNGISVPFSPQTVLHFYSTLLVSLHR